jgi:hypothetical protein
MAKLTDEHRRALQVLAREPVGCAEVALLAEGFSVGQLATLAMDGFAKRRKLGTAAKPGHLPDTSTILPFATPKPASRSAALKSAVVISAIGLKKRMVALRAHSPHLGRVRCGEGAGRCTTR